MKIVKSIIVLFIIGYLPSHAQLSIETVVKHIDPAGSSTSGSINLTVSGGTSPYTYSWSASGATTQNLSSVAQNSYVVTVTDNVASTITRTYNLGFKTFWTDFFGLGFSGDSLFLKSPYSPTSWNNAYSKNTLKSGNDGWAEIALRSNVTSNEFLIGFLDSISPIRGQWFQEVDYGVYIIHGNLYALIGGGTTYLGTCAKGDAIKIERIGSTFYLRQNGVSTYSCTMSGSTNYKLKASLPASPICNIGASFDDTTSITFPGYVQDNPVITHCTPGSNNGSISLSARISGATHTYSWSPGGYTTSAISSLSVTTYTSDTKDSDLNLSKQKYNVGNKSYWTNFYGVLFRNDSLMIKNSISVTGWNTAISKNTLKTGNDGWAEIVIRPNSGYNDYILGLLDSASTLNGQWVQDIDFGFYLYQRNIYRILSGSTSLVGYATDYDVLRIQRVGSTYSLLQNGVSLSTATLSGSADYKLKTALAYLPVCNIGTSFIDTNNVNFPGYVLDYKVISHCTPGSNNGAITLTPAISGATHTYSWSPGGYTTSAVSNLSVTAYTAEVKDTDLNDTKQWFNVGYKTYWTNLYGLQFRMDSLILKAPLSVTGWNTAASKNTLKSNVDGWAELVIRPYTGSKDYMLGFCDSLTTTASLPVYGDIDFGFYIFGNSIYYLAGGSSGLITTTGIKDYDVMRIERSGSNLYLKQNNVTLYTYTMSAAKNLKLKAVTDAAAICNIGASFMDSTSISFPNYVTNNLLIKHSTGVNISDGDIKLTPEFGNAGHTYTWSPDGEHSNEIGSKAYGTYTVTVGDTLLNTSNYQYNVLYKTKWTRFEAMKLSNDSLISKTPYTSTGWSTALSKNILKANQDGEYDFISPGNNSSYIIVGFLTTPSSSVGVYTDINEGLYLSAGVLYYYNGSSFTNVQYYKPGDLFRIQRTGTTMKYYHNNDVVNTHTVSNSGIDWKIKTVIYQGASIANIGASFKTPLDANISKQHVDLTVNPFGGSVAITPTGGISPYTISWTGLDGVSSFSGTGMGQASYTVTIADSSGTDKIAKIIDIGAKINWAYTNNITFSGDSAYATGSGTLGTAVSDNNINLNDETWYVGKIQSLNHDLGIGFVGVSNTSDFPEPPDFASSDVGDKIVLADTLMQWAKRLAFPLNSAYGPDSVLDLGDSYNNVHMMRLRNGIMHSLSNGSAYRKNYTYKVGDEVKIGRNSNSQIYLAINGQIVYTHSINIDPQYLFPILIVNTGTSMGGPGVFTQGYNSDLNPHIGNFQLTDDQYNWNQEETYDENGNVIATQKTYLDNLGRTTQNLAMNANNEVFTSATIYDSYGRAALQTLPALTTNGLTYYYNFFKYYWGGPYCYSHFDLPLTLNNPATVANVFPGTLGNYYSDNNTYDTYQATADLPYSRIEYTGDPGSMTRRVSKVGNAFKMGSGRESWSFTMASGDELSNVFGSGLSYKCTRNNSNKVESDPVSVTEPVVATKQIAITPDNKEMISYSIGNRVIATCFAALTNSESCNFSTITSTMAYAGTNSADIHLPDANKSSLTLPQPTQATTPTTTTSYSNIIYTITDLYTDNKLTANTDYSLNTSTGAVTFYAGFLSQYTGRSLMLRISFAYNSTYEASLLSSFITPADLKVVYGLDYGHFSKSYYDIGGALRKSVSPKGFACGSPTVITMATKYDYDHNGQVIAIEDPDQGLTQMTYDQEGKPRFSQNADQANNYYFSYVNYDKHARPIEIGECHTSTVTTGSIWFQDYYNAPPPLTYTNVVGSNLIINQSDGILSSDKTNTIIAGYVIPAGSYTIPAAYSYSAQYQNFRNGSVNYIQNSNTNTWFNYDKVGRSLAALTQITESDFIAKNGGAINDCMKTSDGSYNYYNGLPSSSTFQKNNTGEKMDYVYSYDVNLRPAVTTFSWANGAKTTTLSTNSYDKLGRIKRVELGEKYQGIDFVYRLNGGLKAINHPGLDPSLDRGGDNGDYTGSGSSVNQDLFGEILEYYNNDYQRSGTNISSAISASTSIYDGLVYTTRFKTQNVVNTSTTGANYIDYMGPGQATLITTTNYSQQELSFQYTYDQFNQLATSNFYKYNNSSNTFTSYTAYAETGASGGNIQYDKNGNITRMVRQAFNSVVLDNLTYTVGTGNNQLTSILDAAVNTYSSGFNFRTTSTVSPSSFSYNAIGQMTASAAESVTAVEYFPDGKVKKITFGSGNTTEYEYDAMGSKLKSKYYNASTTKTKYTWYVGPLIYELDEAGTNSFVIAQANISGGELRVNYATITSSAYPVYHIKDHLGNVRATFKGSGTGNGIEILSFNDYYAFGGQLPGRIWASESTRYGYQGQEKSSDGSNPWYQFDLRMYNQDIGRWFAPDPMGQFASPYVAMANNPVSLSDPSGGWIDAAPDPGHIFVGKKQQDWERENQTGYFAPDEVQKRYDRDAESLRQEYSQDGQITDPTAYLQAMSYLNNEYYGMAKSNGWANGSITYQSGSGYLSLNQIELNAEVVRQDNANMYSMNALSPGSGTSAFMVTADAGTGDDGQKFAEEKRNQLSSRISLLKVDNLMGSDGVWTGKVEVTQFNPDGSESHIVYDEAHSYMDGKDENNDGEADKVIPVESYAFRSAVYVDKMNNGAFAGTSFSTLENNPLKQFFAVVAGESTDNHDEAQAIGEVLQRRMEDRGVEMTDGFINKIGGKSQYDAIDKSIYNSIMKSSWEQIFSPENPYAERIKGAIHSYISPEDNISLGARFWNATNSITGFNWNNYNSGNFYITIQLGGTTFFNFLDPNKKF